MSWSGRSEFPVRAQPFRVRSDAQPLLLKSEHSPKSVMLNRIIYISLALFVCLTAVSAQVPVNIGVQILKAEDARRYDPVLENLLMSPSADVRQRAALAAGRIGDDRSVERLIDLLINDKSFEVQATAAFALGEIESIKASDAILAQINRRVTELNAPPKAFAQLPLQKTVLANGLTVFARATEAAGKIAAANPKDEKSKVLGAAVLNVLDAELKTQTAPNVDVICLGLTAVLRARPVGAEEIVRKFLAYSDPDIVGTALNTLARLRAKNTNRDARDLLSTHLNANVRANAARVLAAGEDKEAVNTLIKASTEDPDLRVRVSSIRALAAVGNQSAGDALVERMYNLLTDYNHSKFSKPVEKN